VRHPLLSQVSRRIRRSLGTTDIALQLDAVEAKLDRLDAVEAQLEKLDRRRSYNLDGLHEKSTTGGLSYEELVELLFPGLHDPSIRAKIDDAATDDLTSPTTIRRMISTVEQQLQATPFLVRFAAQDVVFRKVGRTEIAVDLVDCATSNQMLANNSYEPHLTSIFETYCQKGMTVVDVGANVGYYTLLASQLVGPSGRVLAFEPNSENVRLLLASLQRSGATNVEVLPVACDLQRGWTAFRNHTGSNGGVMDDADLLQPCTIVPTFTLDELVEGDVGFLKMDVEGAEGRVVKGAQKLLEKCRPVVTSELSCTMIQNVSHVDAESYLRVFTDLGYSVNHIVRETSEVVSYKSERDLLDNWGSDPFRIEDLLLLP
jgi:FkbM family methyltransferase